MKKKRINRFNYYVQPTNFSPIIEKRYKLLLIFVFILTSVIVIFLYYTQIVKNSYYQNQVDTLSEKIIESDSAPRGRIYDRNGKLLVDNQAIKTIYYKKPANIKMSEEISLAYKVADLIDVDYSNLSDYNLRYFWIINHKAEASKLITDDEYKLLKERKIDADTILEYKIERITNYTLSQYSELDKEAAYIYYLMNKGYYYAEKIIDKDVTDLEYAEIAEHKNELNGFNNRLSWERVYPYGNYFRTILGNVSKPEIGIPKEDKEYYLNVGYSLTDRVGISYLEKQYESVLKGTKTVYSLNNKGEYKLVSEGRRGNDIVLSIDIEMQKALEDILTEELLYTKTEPNSEYFDSSFVVVSNPKTGEILAMAGKQVKYEDGQYVVYDYTPGVITSSVTPGSSVKGASHIVGYKTGNLAIGEIRNDACIKIAATPLKCSFTQYGNIDDLEALKYSSNTYQFQTAIRVGGGVYQYDGPLLLDENAFNIYRSIFAEFGLGVKTGIDLPNEMTGYKGKNTMSGLLLDYSIGQYDNYTPIELSQYINTFASGGYRLEPHLLKKVYSSTSSNLDNLIYEINPTVLNKVDIDQIYIDRVKEGFKMVFEPLGTGYGIIDSVYKPAGKTGTAETFIDTNNDGIVDTETITSVVLAYAPYDNPEVSFTVISPNVAPLEATVYGMSRVNNRITQKVSQKYFEICK